MWSCYRDLNPGPLPYQGSALPLSYNSNPAFAFGGSNPSVPTTQTSVKNHAVIAQW